MQSIQKKFLFVFTRQFLFKTKLQTTLEIQCCTLHFHRQIYIYIKFQKHLPKSMQNCFFWPPRDDIYHVSFTHIFGLTGVPNIVGRHGQNSYKISAKLFELFNQNLSKLLNRKQKSTVMF